MEEKLAEKVRLAVTVLFFAVIAYVIFTNASFVKELATGYGLLGIFIAAAVANATVFLPMPIDLVVLAINAQTQSISQVIILGIVVGAGASVGEMTAYAAGLLGVKTAEKIKASEFEKLNEFRARLESMGALFIFVAAVLPLPFDLIGIAAGFIKYDPKKFFVAAFFGKICRFIILGLLAFYGFGFLKGTNILPQ